MIKVYGIFETTSGKLRVCDPCYNKSIKSVAVLEVLKGKYLATVGIKENMDGFGERVNWLEICHQDYLDVEANQLMPDVDVGVDSGQAGFFDDEHYPDGGSTGDFEDLNSFYGKACNLTLQDEQGGIIDSFGVVSSSGYGDGVYELYVGRNSANQIVSARINFWNEEADWE